MRFSFDLSLYLVTDRACAKGRGTLDIVKAAVRGGVTMVQLREKELSDADFIAEAKRLKNYLNSLGIPLIINDNVEVARAAQADGVHLGRDDMTPVEARKILGDQAVIGLSVGSVGELKRFDSNVDYVGIGPAYATQTKSDAGAALGVQGIQKLREKISVPCVAIGGINESNAAEVMQSGVDGIAVVSAICAADDSEQAARNLKSLIA